MILWFLLALCLYFAHWKDRDKVIMNHFIPNEKKKEKSVKKVNLYVEFLNECESSI